MKLKLDIYKIRNNLKIVYIRCADILERLEAFYECSNGILIKVIKISHTINTASALY